MTSHDFRLACERGECDKIDTMLTNGYIPSENEATIPCYTGDLNMFERMLSYITNKTEALYRAITNDQVHLLNRLYVEGANIYNLYNGTSILHYVKSPEAALWCLTMGIKQTANNNGSTPLHWICQSKRNKQQQTATVRVLLEHGAVQSPNEYGETPLHKACLTDNEEMVILLLAYGGKQIPDCQQYTPLHRACGLSTYNIVKILLEAGAEITTDKYGHTPLYGACFQSNTEIFELLLSYGATLQADNEGNTPLHWAVEYGNIDRVRFIYNLDHTLKDVKNNYMHTPYNLARIRSLTEIARFLKQS